MPFFLPYLRHTLAPLLIAASMAGHVHSALIIAPTHASREAQLSTAQHLRDQQDWAGALSAYQAGLQQFPGDSAFQFGEIYVLADSGDSAQAAALASELLRAHPGNADVLLVMGYAQLRHAGVFASLQYIDQAYQLAKDRPYVIRDYIQALQRARMARPALLIAQRYPDLLTPASLRELQADAIAEAVRHADMPARSEAERFAVADQALADYAYFLPLWEAVGPDAQRVVQRARIDRLQALHARYAMSEVVQEYEALLAQGVAIPDYALGSVASAYLYLRRPETARVLYQGLIERGYLRDDPSIRQDQDMGLLYAYSDQGDVATSQQLAQPLPQDYPQWRYVEGDQQRIPNTAFLDAQHTSAMMDFYANANPQAQRTLQNMVSAAPGNPNLRTDLAWLYRSRGWPRSAEEELKLAELYDPRGLTVQVGQGMTALALQEWRQAETLSADSMTRFAHDRRAQRLARLWQVHNMAQWSVSGYRGLSDRNPVSGGRDLGLETTLYSQPLGYHWRLFAGAGQRRATFDNTPVTQRFARLGLEWRSRDVTVLGELARSRLDSRDRSSSALSIDYALSDTWSLQAGAQWRSRDTNLDALRNNITSNRLELGVQWRASEQRSWGLSWAPSRWSDGNRRDDFLLRGQERLWTRPTWFLDAGIELYAMRNRRSNVPYYSPSEEYSAMPSLSWNHTLHQRYETLWTQQINAGIGSVHQRGFPSAAVGMLSYGQRYRQNDVFELGGTLSLLTRPYDGNRERDWRLVFDMTYRF